MAVLFPLLTVLLLASLGYAGAQAGCARLLGVWVPYAAWLVFLAGTVWRMIDWSRSPAPFCIPTTAAQHRSLDGSPRSAATALDNPSSRLQAAARVLAEALFFRSLFRNTVATLRPGPTLAYVSAYGLCLAALAFHYSLLAVLVRHLRYFLDPIPGFVSAAIFWDSLLEAGLPRPSLFGLLLLAALLALLGRRLLVPSLRAVSLPGDYFLLFLLLGVAGTGLWMRHLDRADLTAVKALAMGLATFRPAWDSQVSPLVLTHLFLASTLFACLPFSKLTHMAGQFFSPTRNLPNDSRVRRHVNPWNPPKKYRTYELYEEEFRDRLLEAGIPVDKQPGEDLQAQETRKPSHGVLNALPRRCCAPFRLPRPRAGERPSLFSSQAATARRPSSKWPRI